MDQKIVSIRCQGAVSLPRASVKDFQGGLKSLPTANYEKLKALLLRLGFSEPVSVWLDPTDSIYYALNGHQRLKTLEMMAAEGFTIPAEIPCNLVNAESREEAKAKLLSLTSQFGEMSGQGLFEYMRDSEIKFEELQQFNFPDIDMEIFKANFVDQAAEGTGDGDNDSAASVKLADRFIIPPFSILDTKQGYWQDRRRQWLALGIQSETGRKGNLLGMSKTILEAQPNSTGTSIFDPVVCEIAYKWFCPLEGLVLDPFAGGSVRGIVASRLGLKYHGCDLRQEQIDANLEQAKKIVPENLPFYVCGDSRDIDGHFNGYKFDFLFSCPPYADLEKYSDDPRDISNMEWPAFMESYREIIKQSVALLKPDAFCVWVISDVRWKGAGYYRGLVRQTIEAFEDAGALFYNDMVLLNSIGTTALRAGRTFSATRKVGRIHQNVLVFCKGDVVKAVQALGEIQIELPENGGDGDAVGDDPENFSGEAR